jgi:hypothetical protein
MIESSNYGAWLMIQTYTVSLVSVMFSDHFPDSQKWSLDGSLANEMSQFYGLLYNKFGFILSGKISLMQGFHRVWKSGKGEQDQICFSRL